MFDRVRAAFERLREEFRDPFDLPDWPDADEPAGFWDAGDRAAESDVRRG